MLSAEDTEWFSSLLDEEAVHSTYNNNIRFEGRRIRVPAEKELSQGRERVLKRLTDEIAVLQLLERQSGKNLIERVINISRCALANLDRAAVEAIAQETFSESAPELDSIVRGNSEDKLKGSKPSSGGIVTSKNSVMNVASLKDIQGLPMNVQLGVYMLLKMVDTLQISNNTFALQALLQKLPDLLAEQPSLAMVENEVIAREVFVRERLKALGLDRRETLNRFELRKVQIKRKQERNRMASISYTASAGIPTVISQTLEEAYLKQARPLGSCQKNAIGLQEKQEKTKELIRLVEDSDENLASGALLSVLLGLGVKRGSLATIARTLCLMFSHGCKIRHKRSREESKEGEEEEEESKGSRDDESETRTKNDILSMQDAENDLDVEAFISELTLANPTQALEAFWTEEPTEQGGILMTWGKGDHGKLGHGRCTEVDPDPSPHTHEHCPEGNCTENIKTPRFVKDLEHMRIRKVASLSTHSLALTTDGILYTWGNGDKNRLGHGSTNKEYYPRIVNALRTKPPVKDVACGLGHTLALLENGHVYAWGNGGNGRLGVGDSDDRALACLLTKWVTDPADEAYLAEPTKHAGNSFVMPAGIEITNLYCGASHSMAVAKDGRCFTWGKNNQGQCGHGDVADKMYPHLVRSLCKYVTKTIIDDSIPEEEERKDGAETNAVQAQQRTRTIEELDPACAVHSMAGGWEHTLALLRDGRLFSFGSGYKDSRRAGLPPVLGHGGTEREMLPRQILALQNEFISYCACGWDHSLAVTRSGHIYSWGAGTNGKLGHGDEESRTLPQRIESGALHNMTIVQVEAGCEHSVAVSDEGYLFTWGHGDSGRLGHCTNRTEKRPKRVESLAERGLPVLSVAVGDKYNLILTEPTKEILPEVQGPETASNQSDNPARDSTCVSGSSLSPPTSRFLPSSSERDFGSYSANRGDDVGRALLRLPVYRLPSAMDDLVPEWMLSSERVALFVLAQLERLATATVRHLAQVDSVVPASQERAIGGELHGDHSKNSAHGAQPIFRTVLKNSHTLVIPGIISGWTPQAARSLNLMDGKQVTSSKNAGKESSSYFPKIPAIGGSSGGNATDTRGKDPAVRASSDPTISTLKRIIAACGGAEKLLLPYCIETSTPSLQNLVALLRLNLQAALENKGEKVQSCGCRSTCNSNNDDVPSSVRCSRSFWTSVWCTLRIIKANLGMLSNESEVRDSKRETSLSELHGLLLQIVDGDEKVQQLQQQQQQLLPEQESNENMTTCYRIEAVAARRVASEAAATIQVGFTRFYPTSESRLNLLRHLRAANAKNNGKQGKGSKEGRTSATVLGVLMNNLAREEAMMPLVIGMTRTGFDVYSLLVDLLDNFYQPSHLRLLLSFQSHALTLCQHQQQDEHHQLQFSDLLGVMLRYAGLVLQRSQDLVKDASTECSLDNSIVSKVLPSLLSTLAIIKPVTKEMVQELETRVGDLLETICARDFSGSKLNICAGLLSRLYGRLVCCGEKP